VIIGDMRRLKVAANFAAAFACAFSGASRRICGVAATPSDAVRCARQITWFISAR
jgi:hypothetical protein